MKKIILPFLVLGSPIFAPKELNAQNGYIQIIQSAISEEMSPDFTYSITGTSLSTSAVLADRPETQSVHDLGATDNGGLWVVAGYNAINNAIWYRQPGASEWVNYSTAFGVSNAQRIDGGSGNTFVASTSTGNLLYWNGSSLSSQATGYTIKDITILKTNAANPRIYYIDNTNRVYYRDGIDGTEVATNAYGSRIDVDPLGNVYIIGATNIANGFVNNIIYKLDATLDLSSKTSLGYSAGSIYYAKDIATTDDGILWTSVSISTHSSYAYRYSGSGSGSSAWIQAANSWGIRNGITGGNAGAVYGRYQVNEAVDINHVPETIFTRVASGDWIDDNRVSASCSGNTILIPVSPGVYEVEQNAVPGWWLNRIDVKKAASNSSIADVATATAGVTVAAGEIVTLIYQNALDNPAVAPIDCDWAFIENFGAAPSSSSYVSSSPIVGQSSYHHQPNNNATMDGYYTITNQSGNIADLANHHAYNYLDHTNPGFGNMLLVNASNQKEEFFRRRLTGLTIGTHYVFSAWIMNVNGPSPIKPNVKFEINDPVSGLAITNINTGNIIAAGVWKKYTLSFVASQTDIDVVLRNNSIGGAGNDLAIDDISFAMATDKGDAPDSYGTLITSDGPCHVISTELRLGLLIDGEVDGQPTLMALGDDEDGFNDEDGVSDFPVVSGDYGQTFLNYEVGVSVFNNTGNNAYLYGWIDWNNDGTFSENERTWLAVPSAPTQQGVQLAWSDVALTGAVGITGTYARFRIGYDVPESKVGASAPKGSANIGEVEDYFVPFVHPLPVAFSRFEIYKNKSVVQLEWELDNEKNNSGFEIERSANGISWGNIGWVGSKAVGGNGSNKTTYNFTDLSPLSGNNFYRLKQTDFDGKYEYSPIRFVNISINNAIKIAPNPASESVTISNLVGGETITIYDMTGRNVNKLKSTSSGINIDLRSLSNGVYNIHISCNDGSTLIHRLLKN